MQLCGARVEAGVFFFLARPFHKMAAEEQENMKSLEDDCTNLKLKYDSCFNIWFRDDFLRGKLSDHQTACGELFATYQKCLKVWCPLINYLHC